jgi:hypothetical protein
MKEPTRAKYTIKDQTVDYKVPYDLGDLDRYNIAICARKRMLAALEFDSEYDEAYQRWKRERVSFWSTLARSIPSSFR